MTNQTKRLIWIALFTCLFLLMPGKQPMPAPVLAQTSPLAQPTPSAETKRAPTDGKLTLAVLRNAEYRTQYTASRTVKLTNGMYTEAQTGLHIELTEFYAFGDLNKDGVDDAAAVLLAQTGQQAPAYELVAVTNQAGQTVIGGLILLGKGVKINQLAIANGEIVIDYLRPQPGDDACCPTWQVTEHYFSRRGLLVPKQNKSFGQLFPYQDGQLYGYVNVLGELVIPAQFALAGEFSEGMAPVSYNGKTTGFINQLGELVITPQFSYAGPFAQGLAIVGLPGIDANAPFLTAYIDRVGRLVFGERRFVSAEPFSEGLAAVSMDGKLYGYIDQLGKLVIEPKFARAEAFSEGVAPVQSGDQYGYIDRAGAFVIKPQYTGAEPFHQGLAQITIDKKVGYINHSGQIVIEPIYDYGGDFSTGHAPVKQGDKFFYIDATGNPTIELEKLTQAGAFAEGLAAIAVGDQYGYIDVQGHFVVPPQFTFASAFKNGLALVETTNSWGLMNSIGEIVLELDRTAVAPTETMTLKATTPVTTPQKTELIDYRPPLPDEVRNGACTGNSELLALPNAWRCEAEGDTFDPCLTGDDGETVVCAPSPAEKYPGFRLILEKPLPEVNVTAKPPSELWQIQTADANVCTVASRTDLVVNNKPVTFICTDHTVILGAIDQANALWQAENATLRNNQAGQYQVENTKTVQVIRAWQPIQPQTNH
ncbi:MAG: WG repeat-containing protein [Caldilineaceae bacterium]